MTFTFYLGMHLTEAMPSIEVPLFISRPRLEVRPLRRGARTAGPWALDSGGFTELSKYGRWTCPPEKYVDQVLRWREEIGSMEWAAVQDWMCEPHIVAKTGLNVREHQRRTIESYRTLSRLAPGVHWVPVIQGWAPAQYREHVAMYRAEGIDLSALPVVGIGSVCRRQATDEAEEIIRWAHGEGIRLHGFGFKVLGLRRVWKYLTSADSMAWSYAARVRGYRMPGHTHRTCGNCADFALAWRQRLLDDLVHVEATR